MDKEGQNADVPNFGANTFNSNNIGNRATSEYFSNVKGGKKDKEKVAEARSRKSRKPLFITLGALATAFVVVAAVTLVMTFITHRHGSRTDEEMPTNTTEIEQRAYKVLYSSSKYENSIAYLNDLIKDMKDLGVSSELIFEAYAVRARIAYQAGGEDVAIQEALRLAKEADTDAKKYKIYNVLYYIYSQEGNTDKSNFYNDMINELNVPENKIEGEAPVADKNGDPVEENSDNESNKSTENAENAEEGNNG